MGPRSGIETKYNLQGTGRLRPGRRRWFRGGGEERWSIMEQPSPFPRAVVRGGIHLSRPPGLEGSCPLSGKGTLPIPIPSTFARTP